MSDDRPRTGAEQRLEHDADELDHRLHRLEEHIEDAQDKAQAGRAQVEADRAIAGDWEEERPKPAAGDDPEGAVEGP